MKATTDLLLGGATVAYEGSMINPALPVAVAAPAKLHHAIGYDLSSGSHRLDLSVQPNFNFAALGPTAAATYRLRCISYVGLKTGGRPRSPTMRGPIILDM